MAFYLIYATSKDGSTHTDWCWTQVQAYADYASQLTGETFSAYKYGNLSFNAGNRTEKEYVRDAMEEIDAELGLIGNDNVLVSHNQYSYGYGGGHNSYSTGNGEAVGHAVFSGVLNTAWEVELFVWHELSHTYGAVHSDGNHTLAWTGDIDNVTPMAAAYCHDIQGEPSTNWSAVNSNPSDSTSPDDFCDDQLNFYYDGFYNSAEEARHSFDALSNCAASKVQSWARERAP